MNELSRRLAIGLAISLALNLFLAGFVAARLLRPPPPPPPQVHDGPPSGGARPALGLRRMMRERGVDMRADRQALRKARREVVQSLRAEPFDVERFKTGLAELRELSGQSQRKLHDVLVEAAQDMTHQQRVRLSRNRQLLGGKGRGRRGGRRGPMGPPR